MDLQTQFQKALSPVFNGGSGGWTSLIREPFAGAWQRNMELRQDTILSFAPVYACITRISNDIAKLRWAIRDLDANGIWSETSVPAFAPFLRKPNQYQNPIQFRQWWIMSKLQGGNTYGLKQRDARGVVVAVHILDRMRVQPLVSDSGDVYYELGTDNLNGLPQSVTVPASEIIHDRTNCLFHPLVGIAPLFAAALTAGMGLGIQVDAKNFAENGTRPSGILTAPGPLSDETARRLAETFNTGFTGVNAGKVAVVGDAMKFEPMKFTSAEAQLLEQLKLSAEWVCMAFAMPPFKIGAGTLPAGQKVDGVNLMYYTDCLQILVEEMEQCFSDGFGFDDRRELYVDPDGLLRMDLQTLFQTLGEGTSKSILNINEARKRANLPPVEGGDSPLAQQQNYSLAALAKRDAKADPFATSQPAAAPTDTPAVNDETADSAQETAKFLAAIQAKSLDLA